MEYISLHGYNMNTPSDTEVHAEHQLRVAKNIQNHAELGRAKKQGEKTRMLVGLDLPSVGRGTEAGVRSPHRGNCLSQRRNI